jgi:hypothetical protein
MLRPIIASTVLGGGVGSVLAAAVLLAQADETVSAITIPWSLTLCLTLRVSTLRVYSRQNSIQAG